MNRSRVVVLASVAVVVLLASTLGIRLATRAEAGTLPPSPPPTRLARWTSPAPAASVPAPKAVTALEVPCWGCPLPKGDGWAVRFRTDLDLLAPLGDGTANAALWLKDFAKEVGAREEEARTAMEKRTTVDEDLGKVLAPDDPLLLEAEPWADQATMRFYPDVFPVDGFATRIPNLLVSLTLAKSWVARARLHPDDPRALEDCRRAVRWGRLLRQEDVTIIQDLVGLACIRVGAQGLYELAGRHGDHDLRLVSAIVLGEHAPQRLRTAQFVTRVSAVGEHGVEVSDAKLEAIVAEAKGCADRRFRGEAICSLALVHAMGSSSQREVAEKELLALSGAADPVVSASARWARTASFDRKALAAIGVGD